MKHDINALLAIALIAIPAATPAVAHAQKPIKSSFDRTVVPKAGSEPKLNLPTWSKTTLSNGATLVVSERHTLPLVSFSIGFVGGANQYEPADKTGLASFTSQMMSEGTATRTGDEISNALQLLGTSVGFGIGGESGSISFLSTKDKFAPTLAIMADELLHPAFPQAALDRIRANTLVSLNQAKDRTASIAGVVLPKLLYGDQPYGRTMNEETVKRITRDDIVSMHQRYFQPANATITIVGDMTLAEAKAALEKGLAEWKAGGTTPSFAYPTPPAPKSSAIYIVDKPGAAQSTFALGLVGPPRSTPDYFALRVMNNLFGEQFQSRINANIREQKGYSYGVSSGFSYGRGPGPFRMGGDIQTNKTDSALVEFMKEVKGIRGERPVTDEELATAKAALVQSLPSQLESVSGVRGMISSVFSQGLPENYWTTYPQMINAVTKEDVMRVAKQYIDPDHMSMVIVGDRSKIEPGLRATGIAPIIVLDIKGNPLQIN
jgi:predicted Zn-dependent peptidase